MSEFFRGLFFLQLSFCCTITICSNLITMGIQTTATRASKDQVQAEREALVQHLNDKLETVSVWGKEKLVKFNAIKTQTCSFTIKRSPFTRAKRLIGDPELVDAKLHSFEYKRRVASLSVFYRIHFVNLGSLTAGISFAWPSPMIVKLYNGTDTSLTRPITEEEGSWIVSGGYLVTIVTNLLGGILIDKIGRKYSIILVAIPRIFVSIWTIFVTEVWMLILCRVIMLITDSFIYVVVSVYISEIACKEHRGSLGTFLQIFSCIGIITTFIVGPFLSYRAFNTVLAIAIVVSSLLLPFIPQSPVYLHSKDCIDEAIKVLYEIRDSDENIIQELEDYKLSKQTKVSKIALLKNRTFLKSVSLGSLICAGTSGIGNNAVSFYMQTILESSHTIVKPDIASAVIGCTQLFAAICSCFLTKMFGRRPIMIYSILGMFIGLVCLGTFFKISTKSYSVTGFLNYLPVISLMLCTYSYNVGIGSLVFVVTVELFDGTSRALGCSICWGWTFLLDFLTSKYFAEAISALGPSETYWFFSIVCLLVASLITFFVPETKGKTFSEIQISLGNQGNTH